MNKEQGKPDFGKISNDALLQVSKELFLSVYPTRMPDGSDPKGLCEAARYDRTAQAKYLAEEFSEFFFMVSNSMHKKGLL